MANLTESDTQLIENIDGAFHQLFRAAGVSIGQDGIERIREIATKLAATIEHAGEVKAVQVIQILQHAVTRAFTNLESDLGKRGVEVDKRFDALEERLNSLQREVEAHRAFSGDGFWKLDR
jgi:hypothetical protein